MSEQSNDKQWSDMKALLMKKKQERDKKMGINENNCRTLVPDGSINLVKTDIKLTTSLAADNSGDLRENQTVLDEKKSRNLKVGEVLSGHVRLVTE